MMIQLNQILIIVFLKKDYLTYRPLVDERWHQIILTMRKVNKDDEKYLNEINLKIILELISQITKKLLEDKDIIMKK